MQDRQSDANRTAQKGAMLMRFVLPAAPSREVTSGFLMRNGIQDFEVRDSSGGLAVQIGEEELAPENARILARHFSFYDLFKYDLVAAIGARGFILAGALCYASRKPLIPIRKYKTSYHRFDGHRSAPYSNWRGEEESLFLLNSTHLAGSRALFVDDVLETGRSTQAAAGLLEADGISVDGAFFLFDAARPEVREGFEFPVRSLIRCYGLLENTAPAR